MLKHRLPAHVGVCLYGGGGGGDFDPMTGDNRKKVIYHLRYKVDTW